MKKISRLFIPLLALSSILVTSCTDKEPYKSEPEYQYVVSMCRVLKGYCRNPDSFSVSGDCKYGINDQLTKFVVIPFRAQNGFGGYNTDIAYFSKDVFRGTYSEYYSSSCSYDIVTKIIIADMMAANNWSHVYSAEQVNNGL